MSALDDQRESQTCEGRNCPLLYKHQSDRQCVSEAKSLKFKGVIRLFVPICVGRSCIHLYRVRVWEIGRRQLLRVEESASRIMLLCSSQQKRYKDTQSTLHYVAKSVIVPINTSLCYIRFILGAVSPWGATSPWRSVFVSSVLSLCQTM